MLCPGKTLSGLRTSLESRPKHSLLCLNCLSPQCICTPPSPPALWGEVWPGLQDTTVCLVLPAATTPWLPECKWGPFLNSLRSFTTTGLGEVTNTAVVCWHETKNTQLQTKAIFYKAGSDVLRLQVVVSDYILGSVAALTTAPPVGQRGHPVPALSRNLAACLFDGKNSFIPLPSTLTQDR